MTELKNASRAMILLHGRGAASQDIFPLSEELCDETFYITAPQAPNNSWYPHSFMSDETLNEPSLTNSIETVKQLIDTMAKYIPLDQIYLVGFSQGACLALETAARFPAKYGAIIAFTGGLIGKDLNLAKYQGNFEGAKVFIGTSDIDPHIPLSRAEESRDIFEDLGADVTLKVYPGMGHHINEDEIKWAKSLIH